MERIRNYGFLALLAVSLLAVAFTACDNDGNGGGDTTGTVATPSANPGAGTYTTAQSVQLATTTEGASIYYTLDGTTPTASSTLYTTAISISETKTLKAIAVKSGMNNSGVLTAVYTINSGTGTTTSPTGIVMVQIPAGTLTKDPTNTYWTASFDSVTLSAFKIGKYEVTQEQYQAVMGYNPSFFDNTGDKKYGGVTYNTAPASGEVQGKRPVEYVTWYDAVEFCNKLSEMEGLSSVYTITDRTNDTGYHITDATVTADFSKNGYRLPTEAQWQYAAQGGGSSTVTVTDETGWYSGNSDKKTHEVGKKSANAYGLHDMLGNVWEWCWDWFGYTYPSGANNPAGADSGSVRMLLGASWYDSSREATSAYRGGIDGPHIVNINIGLRLVRP